jgi:hypothetical protein
MMEEIFKRVGRWNALRYERTIDTRLTAELLAEELGEFLLAETIVDTLDALCDLTYVAIGGIWKSSADNESIDVCLTISQADMQRRLNNYMDRPITTIPLAILSVKNEDYDTVQVFTDIVVACMTEMMGLGLSTEQCKEAMLIVCDANDSKSVAKTPSHMKANISKGNDFIPAEPRLKDLLRCVKSSL